MRLLLDSHHAGVLHGSEVIYMALMDVPAAGHKASLGSVLAYDKSPTKVAMMGYAHGAFYMFSGLTMCHFPGVWLAVLNLVCSFIGLLEPCDVAAESASTSVLGWVVFYIGVLYTAASMKNSTAEGFMMASIYTRPIFVFCYFMPFFLTSDALADHWAVTFGLLDPLLALSMYVVATRFQD